MPGTIPPALAEPARESRQPYSFAARAACVALCVVSMLAFGQLANFVTADRSVATAGFDSIPASGTVLNSFSDSAAPQKVLFIGTSLFFNGINVHELEAQARRAGCDFDAAVAAYPLLAPYEEAELLESLRGFRARQPDLIVLSSTLPTLNYRANPFQLAPREFVQFAAYEARHTEPRIHLVAERLHQTFSHLALSLVGYRRFDQLWPQTDHIDTDATDGYIPHEGTTGWEPANVRRDIALRERQGPVNWSGWSEDTLALAELRASRVPRGSDVLFLTMPTLERSEAYNVSPSGLVHLPGRISFLNANDAEVFSGIYEAENWQNPNHLSNDGATLFAETLAPHICSMLRPSQQYALH